MGKKSELFQELNNLIKNDELKKIEELVISSGDDRIIQVS